MERFFFMATGQNTIFENSIKTNDTNRNCEHFLCTRSLKIIVRYFYAINVQLLYIPI